MTRIFAVMSLVLCMVGSASAERRTSWYYRGPAPAKGPAVVIVNGGGYGYGYNRRQSVPDIYQRMQANYFYQQYGNGPYSTYGGVSYAAPGTPDCSVKYIEPLEILNPYCLENQHHD